MYGAVHTATAEQGAVRCIDNGVYRLLGQIADKDPDAAVEILMLFRWHRG